MLTHPMVERLRGLGLAAMADAFTEMQRSSAADDLSREDWLGLLIDRETTARESKRLQRRLSQARLRQNAVIEDADLRTPRGLDRSLFQKLAGCGWIRDSQHLTDRRPDRRGKVVAGLCAGPQSLPGRVFGDVSANAPSIRRSRNRAWRGTADKADDDAGAHASAHPRRLGP